MPLTDEANRWALLDLLSRTNPAHPLAWLRNGEGLIGAGNTLRLAFRGPNRFEDAATAWRTISSSAIVDDRVNVAGSGLVGFGSFAFADSSASESVLVIPEVIFGQRDGVAWVTRFSDVTELPDAIELQGDIEVRFHEGQLSEIAFKRAVDTAKQRISAGEVEKVVLARDIQAELPADADLRLVVSHLAHSYDDCATFAIDGMLGASPETLLKVDSGTITGRVLAGTAARGADSSTDNSARDALLTDEKNFNEHALAVQSVSAKLEPVTSSLVMDAEPFALELPNVWHLATDFEGTLLADETVLAVVAALHPTAAVAGTPTQAATTLIAELENFDRGRYAGPIGWLDSAGNAEWVIALRCAEVDGTQVRAFAGAGILNESNSDEELAETSIKFEPIIAAFGGD